MDQRPSMLWHIMVQVTLLCILLACMFHWYSVQRLLCQYVWNNWDAWRAVGFCVPTMFVCGFILFIEMMERIRHRYEA